MKKREYQVCPKCKGHGEVYVNEFMKPGHYTTSGRIGMVQCDVCLGNKIIVSPKTSLHKFVERAKPLSEAGI